MISLRTIIWWLGAVVVGTGLGLVVAGRATLGVIALVVGGLVVIVQIVVPAIRRARENDDRAEPERIEHVEEERRLELIRGTSMHLRDMKYRYSLRYDRTERDPFTAEVNTVILGFVPVIILDNASDKQGFGYVAFPFDGNRWRGPGLPCAGDRGAALEHAARCIAPLDDGEDEAV